MNIQRDRYLKQLIDYSWDGQVKVITGIRRSGKSYLLKELYKNYLLSIGTPEENIIFISLEEMRFIKYRNPIVLAEYVREKVSSDGKYYLFVDEIQMSDEVQNPYDKNAKRITFYDAINDLKEIKNLDVYVTGSNSKMLSKDVLTEFRGRSDEIRMHPLSFKEYYSYVGGDKRNAFDEYAFYGGLPLVLLKPDEQSKMSYLKSLFNELYFKDIVERKKIEHEDVLSDITDLLCSSIGSLTNYSNITNSINSVRKRSGKDLVSLNTVKSYIDDLDDAFMIHESKRYDVKGSLYLSYPSKYYFEDVGLRNARIGFRQQEMTHIMENIIYNELAIRGYSIDVGVVHKSVKDESGKISRVKKEIDFIATLGGKKLYIQSAFAIESEDKKDSEYSPLNLTGDSFSKIVVRNDVAKSWYDDNGVLTINVIDFLLGEW
ncbi:MAG: ATP-binding protein [Bacilli bacterium]|jgi:predicted AAA+ superfamily ATPase|nr:ATP-binding protein [Bacilli bacterium]